MRVSPFALLLAVPLVTCAPAHRVARPAPQISRVVAPAAAPKVEDRAGRDPFAYDREGRAERRAADLADVCSPLDEHVVATGDAVIAASKRPRAGAAPALSPWDKKTPPLHLDRIIERFGMTAAERQRLEQNGFVVLDRLTLGTYANAFHEIYRMELPIYVTPDALLHAVFKRHEGFMPHVERTVAPVLSTALEAMHTGLKGAAPDYPDETVKDLDLYLAVARSLLSNDDAITPSLFGQNKEVDALVASAKKANGMSTANLFGRPRIVDFSQYQPRGHYAREANADLIPYFRASMWLSRLEFNLASRATRSSAPTQDPRETPREAVAALALADLAQRASALSDIDRVERTWRTFAGKREDVSFADLAKLRAKAGIKSLREPDAGERLRAAIGPDYVRTANFHYQYGEIDTKRLPVIATMLGPGIVPDAAVGSSLVHPNVPGKSVLRATELAYALGQDRALTYLAPELQTYPALGATLSSARADLAATTAGADFYGNWLGALRALGKPAAGTLPSFMRTNAFADMRLSTVVTGYGQLRHNNVLYAAQAYDIDGCQIPDGFVEPAPEFLNALVTYADRASTAAKSMQIDPRQFDALKRAATVLGVIAEQELENRPLSEEAKRYLGMVVEYVRADTYEGSGRARFNGWYLNLFSDDVEAFDDADFIADYFTSSRTGQAAYVGASQPRVGVFVVDTGGGPRAFVGPVARGYTTTASISQRLTDEKAKASRHPLAAWETSYFVERQAPGLALMSLGEDRVLAKSNRALGEVTVESIDVHGAALRTGKARIGPGLTVVHLSEAREGTPRFGSSEHRVRLADGTVWFVPDYPNLRDRPWMMGDVAPIDDHDRQWAESRTSP